MKKTIGAFALFAALNVQSAGAQDRPTIYRGGPIVTMDGDTPHLAKAVVASDGKIIFVGDEKGARRAAGKDAVIHDLAGATMLPGFVDAHSHFAVALQMSGGLDLWDKSLPPVTDIASLQGVVRDFIARRAIPKGGWVVVWQYNDEALKERRHITRAELDAVSPDHKIVVLHISLHGLVANSAALAAAGLSDASQPPPGGLMLRDDAGRLNGVLLEKAMYQMLPAMPQPTAEQKLAMLDAAQARYFAEGYTHAQDGATSPADLGFFTSDAARARLKIDLALLPIYTGLDALLANPDIRFRTYQGHVKIEGVKFILDGSPQARTAYFTRDYATTRGTGSRSSARKSSTRWPARSTTAAGRYSSTPMATPRSTWRSRASMHWGSRPPTIAARLSFTRSSSALTNCPPMPASVSARPISQTTPGIGVTSTAAISRRRWSISSAPSVPRAKPA